MAAWHPQVFVSYTKRPADGQGDRDFVRRLFGQLETQSLNLWVYEDEEGEIRGGQRIDGILQQRIDQSHVFVPVVSLNSFQSSFTALEVSYALQRSAAGKRLLILPVVSHRVTAEWHGPWPEPYAALSGIRYHVVDFDSPCSLDEAILALCADVGVEYRPPLPQDPRMPHMDRFLDEVRRECPRRDDRENGVFRRLMGVLNQFSAAVNAQQFEPARRMMQFFCLMCEYEFPQTRFYYPYIVRAVCETLTDDLDAAEQTFRGLLDNPRRDESLFSGLGYLAYQQGDYQQALAHYREASRLCPDDPAARAGIVLNAVMTGESVDLDEAFRIIEASHVALDEDRHTVQSVKAFALASAGRLQEATFLFTQLVQQGRADAATVIHFGRLLKRQGNLAVAVDLLRRFETRFADPVLLHDLATYTAFAGNLAEASRLFQVLIRRCPHERRYRGELAQVLWRSGDRVGAKKAVSPLLDPRSFQPPQLAADFFFDGLANWICGNLDRADYDFGRSGFPPEQHYRNLLPDA
jgi:Flp pilus assembly protein TadD